jgi:hypothetical protein
MRGLTGKKINNKFDLGTDFPFGPARDCPTLGEDLQLSNREFSIFVLRMVRYKNVSQVTGGGRNGGNWRTIFFAMSFFIWPTPNIVGFWSVEEKIYMEHDNKVNVPSSPAQEEEKKTPSFVWGGKKRIELALEGRIKKDGQVAGLFPHHKTQKKKKKKIPGVCVCIWGLLTTTGASTIFPSLNTHTHT